jgi:RNA polymerase sigma-70 factor (ECF subfamily)
MKKQLNESELQDRFQAIYKNYASVLIFYASKFVDISTAEDLVQDVFLKIWNKRFFLLWEEGLPAYLYNAVRHACLDHIKHLEIKSNIEKNITTKLKIDELYHSGHSSSFWQENSRLQSIYQEIEKLPDKCREIFSMSYLEERKAAEIATILHISKRTVEAQLYKALKLIREALVGLK